MFPNPAFVPVPTAEDLQSNPIVRAAMEEAWQDSLPGDCAARHEEGGWIYCNPSTGDIVTIRAAAGERARLNLGNPPDMIGFVLVGTYHTHPNPTAEGWRPGPSAMDLLSANATGVPWLIRSDDGIYLAGHNSRRGGFTGASGFPP